tara:strand:- start:295 stop:1035 length:741 start_codon:yes stop_codon:yes gene_type:complete
LSTLINISEDVLASPPNHVAIIMDGNRRWAHSRGLSILAGHRKGAQVVREVVEVCPNLGVNYLTLFAFSSENWKRPVLEVNDLMSLLKLYISKELTNLHKNNVKFQIIGDKSALSDDIQKLLNEAERITEGNSGLKLCLALNYGSRNELTYAVKKICEKVKIGEIKVDEIDEFKLNNYLYTSGIPDPDLLIRTSGEMRLSNFLLWQLAYTELLFTETLWPDFNKEKFIAAVKDFQKRERRYGSASS